MSDGREATELCTPGKTPGDKIATIDWSSTTQYEIEHNNSLTAIISQGYLDAFLGARSNQHCKRIILVLNKYGIMVATLYTRQYKCNCVSK